jgi:hypothetical protein
LWVDFEVPSAGRLAAKEFAEAQADAATDAAENDQRFQDCGQKCVPALAKKLAGRGESG